MRRAPNGNEATTPKGVTVIGSGYVGLTSAACLAHLGHVVRCTDVLADRVAELRAGRVAIVEAGLPELVRQGLSAGNLTFSLDNSVAVTQCEFVFLCLPTPRSTDGTADLSFLRAVALEIGPHLEPGTIVVIKSTVPVGGARIVADLIARSDVDVVSNPEFLREGSAVADFLEPDRVIVGADSERAATRVASLYRNLATNVVTMDSESAELLKYAANAFLATKLSFVNSIATLCERLGADIGHVTYGMGLDKRIGAHFLEPGPGWGGSCFPKDTSALLQIGRSVGFDFKVLDAAIAANAEQPKRIADDIEAVIGDSVAGHVVAMWGLTFKANTDDLRCSPAIEVAAVLRARGARVQAYDPTVGAKLDGIEVCTTALEACRSATILVVATEWDELRSVDLHEAVQRMAQPLLFDARNLLDAEAARQAGFQYHGIGWGTARQTLSDHVPDRR